MGKGKSFGAKLAHELTTEGKVICSVCGTEKKKIKLILNKDASKCWTPRYEMQDICKCNENDLMAGKF